MEDGICKVIYGRWYDMEVLYGRCYMEGVIWKVVYGMCYTEGGLLESGILKVVYENS